MDEIFQYNFKLYSDSPDYFWFEIRDGVFGYCMGARPEVLNMWDRESAEGQMHKHNWIILSPRNPEEVLPGPIVRKIRHMEARHKRFLERKHNV